MKGPAMNEKLKKGSKSLLRWMTPLPVLSMFASQTIGSIRRSAEALRLVGSGNEDNRNKSAEDVEEFSKLTPEQRFQKSYEDGAWTEDQLAIQSGRIRVAKFVLIIAAIAIVPFGVATFIYSSWWLAVFLGPATMAFSLILMAQALRHAWWGHQIKHRSMISFREFMSLESVWRNLFE